MGANGSVPAVYDAPAFAIIALAIVLTTGSVLGRFVSRRLMKAGLAADDCLCYAAYVTNLGLLISALLCEYTKSGSENAKSNCPTVTTSGALDLRAVSHQTDDEKNFTRTVGEYHFYPTICL